MFMATQPCKSRPRRSKTQLPHCYYEGFLEKRSPDEKVSRRLWACLCGNTLFFYINSKDNEYMDKLELSTFVSLSEDSSSDRKLEAVRLNLRMLEGEIKLTVPTLEALELWKGYIYAVAKLTVPSSLNLLPGQVNMLREVIEKERARQALTATLEVPSNSIYLSVLGDMPPCYQNVCRRQAMTLLERYHDCGNLLMRPGRDGNSLAVTTRQDINGPKFQNYRVCRKHDGGFVIDLKDPVPCDTLEDVVSYFVEKTCGYLKPFFLEETYDDYITYVESNDENGEKSLNHVSSNGNHKTPLLPVTLGFKQRSPSPDDSCFEENLYLNDELDTDEQLNTHTGSGDFEHSPPTPPPKPVTKPGLPHWSSVPAGLSSGVQIAGANHPPKVALMPPATGRLSLVSTESPDSTRKALVIPKFPGVDINQNLSEELKRKLELRRANQQ